jgi:hypothetical protein
MKIPQKLCYQKQYCGKVLNQDFPNNMLNSKYKPKICHGLTSPHLPQVVISPLPTSKIGSYATLRKSDQSIHRNVGNDSYLTAVVTNKRFWLIDIVKRDYNGIQE